MSHPLSASPGEKATIAAIGLGLLAVLYLLLVPVYTGEVLSQDSTGGFQRSSTRSSLIAENGWGALLPVLLPVAVCVGAAAARHTRLVGVARVGAAVLLWAFVVVAGFSIGLFYLPSAVAMTIAAHAAAWPRR